MHAIYGYMKDFYTNNKLSPYVHLLAHNVSTQTSIHQSSWLHITSNIIDDPIAK